MKLKAYQVVSAGIFTLTAVMAYVGTYLDKQNPEDLTGLYIWAASVVLFIIGFIAHVDGYAKHNFTEEDLA